MQDDLNAYNASLADHQYQDWREKIARYIEAQGSFTSLGSRHFAAFVEKKPVLLVTFETIQRLRALPPQSHPLGWEFNKRYGWSQLNIVSDGESWFRDSQVYNYFDRLIDDGFFDDFEQVIFFGTKSCGYAASAYSVAAPGSIVIAIQPQATLDPRITGWDRRFIKMRRLDFTNRYGYAPEMLDAAEKAYIIYDPYVALDAAHAALFTRPNVTKLRIPHMGSDLHFMMNEMEILQPAIKAASDDVLSPLNFAKLIRARRNNRIYLNNLLRKLELDKREALLQMLCRNVTSRMQAPRFAKRLEK